MEMIKTLLVASTKNKVNGKIIQITDEENWQFSFEHDENKLHLVSLLCSRSSPYTWICIQIAIFIPSAMKQFHANWIET